MLKNEKVFPRYKLFSWQMLLLCITGLALNLAMSKLVLALKLPLFLDNIGAILTAALGGALPGMLVGFTTNVINSVSDPITLYYGILSVLIALLASWFSSRELLKTIKGCLLAAFCFMFIGGACGSIMTWLLYGGGMGEGISAPLANWLAAHGLKPFAAQFLADVSIDFADKVLTMIPIYLILHFYPRCMYDVFPLSYIYDRDKEARSRLRRQEKLHFRRRSINKKIVLMIIVCLTLISLVSTMVSIVFYRNEQISEIGNSAKNISHTVSKMIDGDRIDEYLEDEFPSSGYKLVEEKLESLIKNTENIEFLYVYKIEEDGCHVVFDIDVRDVPGSPRGSVVSFSEEFLPYKEALLAGRRMEPVVSNGCCGHLVSSYSRIMNSAGVVKAYVGVDMSLDRIIPDIQEYTIKMIAIQFGISIIIVAFAILYVQKTVSEPITSIVELSRKFDETDPEKWLDSDDWKNRIQIKSGDEIEELYNTVCKVETNVSVGVTKLRENERKMMRSRDLEKKNEELAAAIKRADDANAAKSDFLSRMSHDMRTPMNGILGLATLMKEETDVEKIHSELDQVMISGKYLLNLINDTLDVNKIEAGKLELHLKPINGELLLGNVLSNAQMLTKEKGHELNVTLPPISHDKWVPVLGDASRIEQILMNLISNAVKYTPKGGRIELIMETQLIDENSVTDRYTVADNGIGMTKEFLPHLFEPFAQEGRMNVDSQHGTGLGMSIVKRLVELMDGAIEVESEPDNGTRVTVVLKYPRYFGKPERDVKIELSFDGLKGKHVLVVEDHPLNAEITGRLLEKKGMTVVIAKNGKEGVDFFTESEKGTFDAILMDVRMPVMDGIEATKTIRASSHPDAATVPIIAMTANAYDSDVKTCLEAGMNEHLAKPVEPDAMYMALINYIK